MRRTLKRTCNFRQSLFHISRISGSTHSLAQWPALTNSDDITIVDTERRGDVGRDVLMPLLVTLVLGDVVEVVAANDEGTVHFGGDDDTSQNLAADRNLAGERALLVCREAC